YRRFPKWGPAQATRAAPYPQSRASGWQMQRSIKRPLPKRVPHSCRRQMFGFAGEEPRLSRDLLASGGKMRTVLVAAVLEDIRGLQRLFRPQQLGYKRSIDMRLFR